MNGKFLRVLRDMYAKAKSCVKTRHGLCSFFVSNVGLCQGEMLSSLERFSYEFFFKFVFIVVRG